MKVLLLQAYLGGSEPPVFPIGLSCIAASVKKHELRVFDPNIAEEPAAGLQRILEGFRPEVIAISLRNIDSTNKRKVVFYYSRLKEILDIIQSSPCDRAWIIVGGSGFSMFAREIMQDELRIDYGVYLEGERTFPELLEHLEKPEAVRGIYYRENGAVKFTGPNTQTDLITAPLPDRATIGITPYVGIPDAIGIETKRGCMLGCIYCIYGFLNGKNMRLKPPVRVVDEIETLVKEHGVKGFTFIDSVFNVPSSHAEEICREMSRRKLKVKWSAWFNEKGLTRQFIELARDAGCKNVILSPDGFSDEILKKLGKNIKKEDILKGYAILKNIEGLEVNYNFFKNPPGQTFAAFLSLMSFCLKARREMGRRVHFEFNSIRIEPHTALFKLALEEGIVKETQNLLLPVYYSNRSTAYIDFLLNSVLGILGK